MPELQAYGLFSRNFFRGGELPLKIFMHEYKSSTDKWHKHHDFYELVLVCSGSARNENRQRRETVKAGNVLLFPSGSVHRYTAIRNFCHYNILFDPELIDLPGMRLNRLPGYRMLLDFLYSDEDRCSNLLSVDEAVLSRLVLYVENIRNEMAVRSTGWQESAYFEFMRLLVYLMRYCVPQNLQLDDNVFQIGRIIRLLEENCKKSFKLQQLADEVNMSVSTFRHHFTAITGVPPGVYLTKLRLRKALLLLTSPTSITSVAAQVGFNDSNYFARQFRQHVGLTPCEFQKKYNMKQISLHELMDELLPENSFRLQEAVGDKQTAG